MRLKSNRGIFLLMIGLFLLGIVMSDDREFVKADHDPNAVSFAGGDGTVDNPYQIEIMG